MAYPGARRGSVVVAKVVSYEARNRVTWGDTMLWAVDGFKTHLAPNFRRHRGFPSLAAQHPPLLQVLKGRREGGRAAELSAGSVKAQFCGGLSVLPQAGALASSSFQVPCSGQSRRMDGWDTMMNQSRDRHIRMKLAYQKTQTCRVIICTRIEKLLHICFFTPKSTNPIITNRLPQRHALK